MSGLAGAVTAAAAGVEGVYNNAAAPAVRQPFSVTWFDFEPTAGFSLPGGYARSDFSNRGHGADPRTDNFVVYDLGLQVQLGGLGISVATDFLSYNFTGADAALGLQLGRIHAAAAYALFDHQLVVGAGVRGAYAVIRADGASGSDGQSGDAFVSMLGAAPQAGVIVKPNDVPFRLGATARGAVDARALPLGAAAERTLIGGERVETAGALVLPDRITLPWQVEAGVAYQLGPRPLNAPWINPHDQERDLSSLVALRRAERAAGRAAELAAMRAASPEDRAERARRAAELDADERSLRAREDAELATRKEQLLRMRSARFLNWPRPYLLLLASVLATGTSADAVALEGFLDQRRELVGRRVSVSPRFAAEGEVLPNLMTLRAGVYFEPSRFRDGTTRQHFTFGGDLRLLAWSVFGLLPDVTWRLTAFVDVSPRYESFGVGIGTWH